MNFSNFKAHVTEKLKGDVSAPAAASDEWLRLLDRAFHDVVSNTIPIRLLCGSGEIYKMVQGKGIRKWELPANDDSELDIDDALVYALANKAASYISKDDRNIMKFDGLYQEVVDNHNWNVYSHIDGWNGDETI